MKKHGQWIGLFVLAQVVVFASLYWAHARAKPVPVVEKPKLIQVSPTALIGNEAELLGHRRAPYTLVEFGDYQCPPCAHRNEQVKRLLEEFPAELRFRFRHYPLEMHRYAMHCALISEISRARGNFGKSTTTCTL